MATHRRKHHSRKVRRHRSRKHRRGGDFATPGLLWLAQNRYGHGKKKVYGGSDSITGAASSAMNSISSGVKSMGDTMSKTMGGMKHMGGKRHRSRRHRSRRHRSRSRKH